MSANAGLALLNYSMLCPMVCSHTDLTGLALEVYMLTPNSCTRLKTFSEQTIVVVNRKWLKGSHLDNHKGLCAGTGAWYSYGDRIRHFDSNWGPGGPHLEALGPLVVSLAPYYPGKTLAPTPHGPPPPPPALQQRLPCFCTPFSQILSAQFLGFRQCLSLCCT